jgi:imidazolonepropionase-like amidohydrolase
VGGFMKSRLPISSLIFFLLFCGFLLPASSIRGQTTSIDGIRKNTPTVHAFTNARIVRSPGQILENATLVIRDGIITAVGDVPIPKDARIWDMKGMMIYPGLINAYSDYGMPKPPQPQPGMETPVSRPAAESQRGAMYWNSSVLAHQSAAELFTPDTKAAEKLRSQGFTSVLAVPTRGNFRGSSALVNLGEGKSNDLLVRPSIAQHVSLEVEFSSERYPNSLMGVVALVRQALYDAEWYQKAQDAYRKNSSLPRPEANETLAALKDVISGSLPVVFEASDVLDLFRAETIADEFHLNFLVRGSGSEYQRLDAVKAMKRSIILPVNFPETPAVQTPEEALQVSLAELRYWDEAPENPRRLQEAGVPFAFTTSQLKDPGTFLGQVRKSVDRGLSKDAALAALTTTPAKLFGVERHLGSIEPGKVANFVVTSGDLFAEKTIIRDVWIDGRRYEVKPVPEVDPRGSWNVNIPGLAQNDTVTLTIKGDPESLQGSIKRRKDVRLSSATLSGLRVLLSFQGDSIGYPGLVRMTANVAAQSFDGNGEWGDGKSFVWSATRTAPFVPEPDTSKPKPPEMSSFPPVYPPGEFGRPKLPEQPAVIMVKNATVWTCGPEGKIDNGDVIFKKGKTAEVGKNLKTPSDALVIDGTGKHVTPGIIDPHSHMAGAGNLNETGRTLSPEVRVGDVINCDDIVVYRNLAGGLTMAHVLHGSANPIGGQNQLIKLRWGMLPDEMKFKAAPPTIKFALGENVKQSNWQSPNPRYPQTRMGVEQIIRDEFRAALDYEKAWKRYEDETSGIPPRRDLRLDAILDVVHGKLIVHCHSYRQDEILAMMRIAEDFGFRIGAFQHILEGYKVADIMAKHGAAGSSFSDWWAYKYEVIDAIPYNGVLMHDQGVLVTFNSDDEELSRRLNLEAAKAVKYGGLSEEEALKFVTINAAKTLKIEQYVGSLEPGKDADFVIWSGNPLSTYTRCEQTWIDGRRYFDRLEDRQLYEDAQHQRAVLVQKALKAKKGGGGPPPPGGPKMEDRAEQLRSSHGEEGQQ